MERRDLFKLTGLGIAAAATTGFTACSTTTKNLEVSSKKTSGKKALPNTKKKRVVIVGGGISGLFVAGSIRASDTANKIQIVVLEKNSRFHACPGSNILLTKTASEYANDIGAPAQWIFNYYKVQEDFMNKGDIILTDCEVLNGNTDTKVLETTKGSISYDTLIMGTGIEYDYEAQFPKWDAAKIEKARLLTPGAMIQDAGNEWTNMSTRWEALIQEAKANPKKQFKIVINPTPKSSRDGKKTLRRCPPAAGERASVLASRIKKEGLKNLKVYFLIELDESLGSKHAAFKQSWEKLGYCHNIAKPNKNDIIQPIFNSRIDDIDFATKTISYSQNILNEDLEVEKVLHKKITYNEAIVMPYQKTPEVVQRIFNASKENEVKLEKDSFEVVGKSHHYILGDSQATHQLPASGSMAMSIAGILANRIVSQLDGKDVKPDYSQATNVCYSLVGENDDRGIKVMHKFFTKDGIIKGKGHVPKGKNGLYMSHNIVLEQGAWLYGIGGLFLATGQKSNSILNK